MRVNIIQHGIDRLHYDRRLHEAMFYHARRAERVARQLAPSGSGEYRRRMFSRKADRPRAGAYYGTDSYKGWWVEFGTVNHRGQHVLQMAAWLTGMPVKNVAMPGSKPGRMGP